MHTKDSTFRGAASICIAAAVIQTMLTGCATMDIPEDKHQPIEAYSLKVHSRGLFLAVNPLRSKEIEETFRTDLLAAGILPILVVAENRSASTSFVLAKSKVAVVDKKDIENIKFDRTTATSNTPGEIMTTAGAALIALPLVIVGMKMASDALVIQHNLGIKEFQSRTIDPGQTAHGYVYFQFRKGADKKLENLHMLIEAIDVSDNQAITFDIPMNYQNQ